MEIEMKVLRDSPKILSSIWKPKKCEVFRVDKEIKAE